MASSWTTSTDNFNPRSPRGERLHPYGSTQQNCAISIHAPREGSDHEIWWCRRTAHDFNPRSPRGERRVSGLLYNITLEFQSTLPARGATAGRTCFDRAPLFQSTLPARGATCNCHVVTSGSIRFQSTLPARGATSAGDSVHLLPRFQSTLPARGATPQKNACPISSIFQSTLPARGATGTFQYWLRSVSDFNPRSPRGERPRLQIKKRWIGNFNPRSPRGERLTSYYLSVSSTQFQSTLPARGATVCI